MTFIKHDTLTTLKTNKDSIAMALVEKTVAMSAFLYLEQQCFNLLLQMGITGLISSRHWLQRDLKK